MADLWQGGRILAGLLAGVLWIETPSAAVLPGGAFVTEDESGNLLSDPPNGMTWDGPPDLTPAFARVSRVDFDPDRESPGRFDEVTYRVWVTAGSSGVTNTAGTPGDTHGIQREQALLRSSTNGQGQSAGRTVDELVDRIFEALGPDANTPGQLVESIHGIQGYFVRGGAKDAEDGVEIQSASFDVIVTNATISRTYDDLPRFKAANATSGNAALTWNQLPQVYSLIGIKILRKAGSTPPSGPNDGTATVVQALLSKTATSYTDAAGAGTWSYAAYGAHDEAHTPTGTAPDRYSAGSPSTVTVT